MKLPPEGSLRYSILSDAGKLTREICSNALYLPESELHDDIATAFEIIRRQERAACQRIAAFYGGYDAEAIAEMIGERNFQEKS